MAKRCPMCGKSEIKLAADFFKTEHRDARYACPRCGYTGALVWEDGDFKQLERMFKSKWMRKKARYG